MAAKLINLLAFVTLFQMMVTIGLRVAIGELTAVAQNGWLVGRALVANYILVPAVTIALLMLLRPHPLVAAGFLIVSLCPGAPFAPPFTTLAKGNIASAVGLMFLLAASSAILAPLLLRILLPIVMGGDAIVSISLASLIGTLLVSQFVPLCIGLGIRRQRPAFAQRFERPAARLSALLNMILIVVLLITNFSSLVQIRPRGYAAMLLLLGASMFCGWLLGGESAGDRRTMAIVTGVRNVGVALLITINALASTPAVSAATSFSLVQTIGAALIAMAIGRLSLRGEAKLDRHRPIASLTTERPA
jgi:BASS family bile acid:Na+ symporter